MKMKQCDLEDIRLACHDRGSGTPVLLVHGYPFNSLIWNRSSGLLISSGYRVIAPDLRGFRKSPLLAVDPVTTMECFADDLARLLQKIGIIEKVVLIGLSMGGYVAMQFARKYEDHLSGIVLCGTKTVADSPQVAENRRKQAAGLLAGSLSLAGVADAMIPKLFSAVTKTRKPGLLLELRNIIIESQYTQGVAAATLGMAERSDTTEVLRHLDVPVLAICGTEDQFSPPSEMQTLAETAKHGTFVEIPESGHLPPMEQPELFTNAVSNFIQKMCFLLLTFFFVFSGMLSAQDRRSGQPWSTRSEVIAQNGMVCSSHPLATQIGIDILKQGGNAVDAAIAVNAALGLMEPTGCGVGGDLFAIVWDAKTQKLYGLNGSGAVSKRLTPAVFKEKGLEQIPTSGPLSVSVPGCVDGWFKLHKRFGSLLMPDILQPTIDYANDGFPLTEVIAPGFQSDIELHSKDYPNVKETFAPNGEIWKKGDVYRNPMLAQTLKLVAEKGRDEFYKGTIARTIADFLKSQGGYLDYEDLASHTSEWIDPVSTNYRGYDVWELPPNGQGITVLQMLNLLELYNMKSFGYGSAEHIHFFVEAKKLAFEDRAKYYADMRFADVPVQQLISKEYAKGRAKQIDPHRASEAPQPGVIANTNNTVYFTTADKNGNMVSMIQSNFVGMGSGMVPPGLGFMLHSRGQSYSLEENHANVLKPGKRPFHTIIPGFITKEGKPFVSFGVMGGDFQPIGHVQIILNLIDFGMNLQEAGDMPRINHSGSSTPRGEPASGGGQIDLESGFSQETVQRLIQWGHQVGPGTDTFYGGYQAIMYDADRRIFFGASECRKDGCAMGY